MAKDLFHNAVKNALIKDGWQITNDPLFLKVDCPMETLEKKRAYRTIIKQLLKEYATYKPTYGDIEIQTIFDLERDHYQVVAVGWNQKERIYGCSIHLDIKDLSTGQKL